MRAGSLIMADTILAEPGPEFFGGHREDTETLSYPSKVKQLRHYVLKPKHVKSKQSADALIRV